MEFDIYTSILSVNSAREKQKKERELQDGSKENYERFKSSLYQTIGEKASSGEEIIKVSIPGSLGNDNIENLANELKQKYRSHFKMSKKSESSNLEDSKRSDNYLNNNEWIIDLHYTEDELNDAKLILSLKEENKKFQLQIQSLEEKLKKSEMIVELLKEDISRKDSSLKNFFNTSENEKMIQKNTVNEVKKKQLSSDNIDPVFKQYFEEKIIYTGKFEDKIQASKILESFNTWAQKNGYTDISDKLLSAQLRKNNIDKHKGHFTYYLSIKFK